MRLSLACALSIVWTSVGCLGPEPQAVESAGAATGSSASGAGPTSAAGTSEASAGGGGDGAVTSSTTSVASSGGDGGAGATSSASGSAGGPGAGGDAGHSASTGDGGSSTGGAGSGGSGSGGGGGDGGAGTGAGGEGTGGSGPLSLGGDVHFLQSGAVTLQNGADTAVVSTNGPFAFPGGISAGEDYDVTVASSPPGQTCWVQNGAGIAAADVTDIDVRCTTILQSKTAAGAADQTTSSTALVPIPDIAPIAFTTDVDATVLATLVVPKLVTGERFHVGLNLDGVTIGEADYVPLDGGAHLPGVVIKIHGVTAGSHTLVPVWSTTNWPLVEHSNTYTSEMNLVVLSSLPSFDRAFTTTLAANAGSTSIPVGQTTPLAMGFTPLSIDVAGAAQPALVSLTAADVAGDGNAARSSIDGQGFAGTVASVGNAVRSFAPIGLTTLTPGNHSLDAEWFRFSPSGTSTRGGQGLPSHLGAVLFKNGTTTATTMLEADIAKILTASFALVDPQLQLSLNLPKPSKVLVTFHGSSVRPYPDWPASADVAIFLNGAQGPTFNAYDSNSISWCAQGSSIAGVVDVPAGTVAIDVRARNVSGADNVQFGNMVIAGATRSILSAVVLD